MPLYLVSCVGQKRPVPAPAKELYTSPWFRKARSYVEAAGQPWFILSAKHGLVHPEDIIAPYEQTLNTMRVSDRRRWAQAVSSELGPYLKDVESVVFLAGQRYRQFLELGLLQRGLAVSVPMEGLKIGEQLSWLDRHTRG